MSNKQKFGPIPPTIQCQAGTVAKVSGGIDVTLAFVVQGYYFVGYIPAIQKLEFSTYTHLSILHLGKQEALSQFKDTFQKGKSTQRKNGARPVMGVA